MPSNEVLVCYVGENKPFFVDFSNILSTEQTLTNTITVTPSKPGLNISNIASNLDKKVQFWIEPLIEAEGSSFVINIDAVANDSSVHHDFVRLLVPNG